MRNLKIFLAVLIAAPCSFSNAEIIGKANTGNLANEAQKVIASRIKEKYESHEFLISGAQSDYDLKIQQSAFSESKVPISHNVVIRSDKTVTFKFNSASNDVITLDVAEGQLVFTFLEVTNIFFTTTEDTNIKVILN